MTVEANATAEEEIPYFANNLLLADVDRVEKRAQTASVMLWTTAGVLAVLFGLPAWMELRSALYRGGVIDSIDIDLEAYTHAKGLVALASLAILLTTAIVYLRWLWAAYTVTPELVGDKTRYSRGWAMWSFLLPLVNAVLPYFVLRDLARKLDPFRFGEPPPRIRVESDGGYREASAVPAAPVRLAAPPLRLWWALYVSPFAIGLVSLPFRDDAYTSLVTFLVRVPLQVAGAIVAALVVKRITARMRECARRVAGAASSM